MNRFEPWISFIASQLGLLTFLAVFGAGCGNSSVKLTVTESKAFDGAPAEMKQAWEKALAADKANDYANAQRLLESLRPMQLNDDQKEALEKEYAAFGQRLWTAAEKNDPAAVKAIQETQNSRGRNSTQPTR